MFSISENLTLESPIFLEERNCINFKELCAHVAQEESNNIIQLCTAQEMRILHSQNNWQKSKKAWMWNNWEENKLVTQKAAKGRLHGIFSLIIYSST